MTDRDRTPEEEAGLVLQEAELRDRIRKVQAQLQEARRLLELGERVAGPEEMAELRALVKRFEDAVEEAMAELPEDVRADVCNDDDQGRS